MTTVILELVLMVLPLERLVIYVEKIKVTVAKITETATVVQSSCLLVSLTINLARIGSEGNKSWNLLSRHPTKRYLEVT